MQASATSIEARDRLILAVDTSNIDEARHYLDELHEHVGVFKIGLQLFTRYGPEILKMFQAANARIFLDCKFLDIPNTVAKAAEEATAHGVHMFTIHAGGGRPMLKAAAEAVASKAVSDKIPTPLVLAVTVLTSISQETLRDDLAVSGSIEDHVLRLAKQCQESGITGLVASPEELTLLRKELGKQMVIVTPGVRPTWASANDQSRFTTPFEAIRRGSDYLVVGRPITSAKYPKDAAKKIIEEIGEALEESK